MTTLFIICALSGAAVWTGLHLALHLLFTRLERRRLAAGAVYRARLNRHVYRRSF
ncbi:MAG: hypothetical protein J0I98_11560 [Mesorhizobium sp.]|nr:hypothetical protein [Mesorhizobium sp.]MBN9243421.1 hypothetical protein [Mesorhizobium sp.]